MKEKEPLELMVNFFLKLPGVGRRTALKYAYFLVENKEMATSDLKEVRDNLLNLKCCSVCNNITAKSVCHICSSVRDRTKILILEDYKDLNTIENLGFYKGLYHIIPLKLNLANGIDLDDLDLTSLDKRINSELKELIIATSLTLEGEILAKYLEHLYGSHLKVTRLAKGVPFGSLISNLDPITLKESFDRRYQCGKGHN